MTLLHKDVVIRNAVNTDAPQLAAWWNDGTVMAHAGFPNGLGTTEQKIIHSLEQDDDNTRRRLIIEYAGVPIGEMSYSNLGNGIAEIGIKICNADYREKGIGRVALSMLIRELFNRGYAKIVLDTNLTNTRARHVYEKLGFTKVRVRIDAWKDQLGQLQSVVDYELLEKDFIAFL